jgi:hypothetical protein
VDRRISARSCGDYASRHDGRLPADRFQYRGAGVSPRSAGKPVFHCDEGDYFTYVTSDNAARLRAVYANSRR